MFWASFSSILRVTNCSTLSALWPGHGVATATCRTGISGVFSLGHRLVRTHAPGQDAGEKHPGNVPMLDKISRYVEAGCRLVLIMRHGVLLDLLDWVARLEEVRAHDDNSLSGRN